MKTLSLISIGAGGVSAVTGASVAFSYYYRGISIRKYVEINKKSKNKIFLTSTTPKLIEIQAKYKTSNRVIKGSNGMV